MTRPDSPSIESVGPYKLEERLGAGGMGEVYRAWDTELERAVAIKLILAEQTASPQMQERFRREAKAIARLDHPTIVRIHHIQKWHDHHCIVMELVEGKTLSQLLKRGGPMLPEQVIPLLRQIASGLTAAHAESIVHRDLKPANVIVTPTGQAKILDFGIAKRVAGHDESISAPGTILGTLHTMSPEQATGRPVDGRSDLFSLGALAYELLTGNSPFRGDTPQETLARVISHRPPQVREFAFNVPESLSQLIDQLLEKNPDRRPSSAVEVVATLDRWTNASPASLSALPPRRPSVTEDLGPTLEYGANASGNSKPAPASQAPTAPDADATDGEAVPAPRHRRWIAAAVALVLLATITAAVFWWLQPPPTYTVAVLGIAFESADEDTTDAWIGTALSEVLTHRLRAHPQLRALPGDHAAQLRRAAGSLEPNRTSLADLRKNLHLGIADFAVTGVLEEDDGAFKVELTVRDLRRGEEYSQDFDGLVSVLQPFSKRVSLELEEWIGVEDVPDEAMDTWAGLLPANAEALRLYTEGLRAWRAGDLIEARERIEDALVVAPEDPALHNAHALILWDSGYQETAATAANRTLENLELVGSTARLQFKSESHAVLKNWINAAESFRQLHALHQDEFNFGLRRATALAHDFESATALELLQKLREKVPSHGEGSSVLLGHIDVSESAVRYDEKKFESAKVLASQALVVGRRTQAPWLEADALFAKAKALERISELDQALADLDRAEQLYRQMGNQRGMLNCAIQYAIVLNSAGRPQEAQQRFAVYRRFFEERNNPLYVAIVSVNQANTLIDLGELIQAQNLLEQSVQTFREHNEINFELAASESNLATSYHESGNLQRALYGYKKAETLFRELGEVDSLSITLTNIGEVLLLQGELKDAQQNFRSALDFDKTTEARAYNLRLLAEVSFLQADQRATGNFLLEASELQTENEIHLAHTQVQQARLALEKHNPGEAEALAKEAEQRFLNAGENDSVTLAQIVRTLALLNRRLPDIESARELNGQIQLQASSSQKRSPRFQATLLDAQVRAREQDAQLPELRNQLLDLALRSEADGYALDAHRARLALGEFELELGDEAAGQARLEKLRAEAASRGWILFEEQAARRLGR